MTNPVTYCVDNGTIFITGGRYSGMASTIIRESYMGDYVSLSAYEVSVLHAFFEADIRNEIDWFSAHLTPADRVIAIRIGAIL